MAVSLPNKENEYSYKKKIVCWSIHLYTALGGIAGLFSLIFASQGKFNEAFLLLILQMVIDATDGMLARRLAISKVLPEFDGGEMDNVIDIFTYAWIPVFIIYQLNILPTPWLLIVPVIASLYAYGQVNMKSDDAFFIGFPTYWNVVAMYLYFLKPDAVTATLIVVIPGILSFIPTRYLYPSKNNYYWKTTWILGAIWIVMVSLLLWNETFDRGLAVISLFFPIYYMGMSFYVDHKIRSKSKDAVALNATA
jgi:phosphatidylcholine synthase